MIPSCSFREIGVITLLISSGDRMTTEKYVNGELIARLTSWVLT